jgi:hypothetical protein
LPALIVALHTVASAALAEPSVAWRVIDGYGAAFCQEYNSHATAGGWVAAFHGLRRQDESDKTLCHAAWVYMQACDCGGTDTNWDIAGGMQKLFNSRGYPHTPVKERCRYSDKYGETCTFSDYVARIKQNLPVIVTYTYHHGDEHGLVFARGRSRNCLSMVGIGYMYYNGRGVLICHDGLTGGQSNPAQADKIDPGAWGLATEGQPWNQPGTSLYRWDGDYTNLLMVLVGKPA